MKLSGVREPVALIENVERRMLRCRVDKKWEGLSDVDAEFRCKIHYISLQCRLVGDCVRYRHTVPGAYLRIDQEASFTLEAGDP